MWIRVALDKESMHIMDPSSCSYVEGAHEKSYYFTDAEAELLEKDGFLQMMWDMLDSVVDWGDCDFLFPEQCVVLKEWLTKRLAESVDPKLLPVYRVMLEYANKAIACHTGVSFDF